MNKKRIFLFLSALVMFVLIAAMSGCRNTVTIIFDDGGNSLTLHVKSGSCVSPPSPEKSGYEFCGWLDKNTGEEFDFSRPITSDVELVAKWQYDRVTVSFDSNGGESVPFQVADRGTYISPPETPTNGYKAFAGWYRQGEDEPFDFSLPVFESVVLVARWETLMVTVYFDSDGGSVVPAKTTEKGERVTPPEPPVREGFDFAGWQTEDGEEFSFEERILSAVTLKAIWRVNSFWVCFDCSGGTEVKNQLVEKGGKAVRPESFRFGYVLLGWYEQDGGEAFDFDVGVYGDVFLTAKWVKTDAFDNLCGEWTGKGATEIGDADYLLVIDQD
ncbi:MAG: InlB B-repeat-containing protein, partial [Christensenellales bacterium]